MSDADGTVKLANDAEFNKSLGELESNLWCEIKRTRPPEGWMDSSHPATLDFFTGGGVSVPPRYDQQGLNFSPIIRGSVAEATGRVDCVLDLIGSLTRGNAHESKQLTKFAEKLLDEWGVKRSETDSENIAEKLTRAGEDDLCI